MTTSQILALLLAVSCAANAALTAGIIAKIAGATFPRAVLTGAGAAATLMTIFFAGVAAYY